MRLCIFEDTFFRKLLPLSWTRPVYHLRCGITLLEDKITKQYPDFPLVYHCREYLSEIVAETVELPVNSLEEDSYLLVNGRILWDEDMVQKVDTNRYGFIYCAGNTEVAAVLSAEQSRVLKGYAGKPLALQKLFPTLTVEQIDARAIHYPWDLLTRNAEEIQKDFARLYRSPELQGVSYPGTHFLNKSMIYIVEDAHVKPGVVLDAENGPIVIDEGAEIMANAVIEGPAYIGRGSRVKIGAKIYGGTSIGEMCKVGGEVECSIIHSFSNKQHDGFLGHAYIGQWVNLGAGTSNSDLKNNYHTVRMTIDGETVDTGLLFVGLIMGDHSKTGINTMFNTGSVAGVHSNVFGAGFPPKYIPSFSWGGSEGFVEYEFHKAIATARTVMARRNVEFTDAMEQLAKIIFEETAEERAAILR